MSIVWFRRDIRLRDNPAWARATHEHDRVTALFVIDPRLWIEGNVRTIQLARHLGALDEELRERGGRLRVEYGDPVAVVPEVATAVDAARVYVNDDYTPYARRRDEAVAGAVDLERFAGAVVHPPGAVLTNSDTIPKVFTPFHKRWAALGWGLWEEAGDADIAADDGEGVPEIPDDVGPTFSGGEHEALARLASFLEHVAEYPEVRNRPDLDMTSRLSSDLHFGTLDPRRVRFEAESVSSGRAAKGSAAFVRQLAWRDFYLHVLYQHPKSVEQELRPEFRDMAWRDDPTGFEAWCLGKTGYPLVDAGMRQLLAEGFIHNRVRMVTASFLVKDLLIDWRRGERWFRRHLLDGDVAQNVGNWQWVAGTGTDAAPYFRVFNPITQSRKFDPDGEYIRRYVPELSGLGGEAIHAPWLTGQLELESAGITLGETYPEPIVEHAAARERALEAYGKARD